MSGRPKPTYRSVWRKAINQSSNQINATQRNQPSFCRQEETVVGVLLLRGRCCSECMHAVCHCCADGWMCLNKVLYRMYMYVGMEWDSATTKPQASQAKGTLNQQPRLDTTSYITYYYFYIVQGRAGVTVTTMLPLPLTYCTVYYRGACSSSS
jgi:hypothetical protein